MEYSGKNFGSDSMQPKHCKYVIGVVDKKSKIVTLHEAPTFAVKQVCSSSIAMHDVQAVQPESYSVETIMGMQYPYEDPFEKIPCSCLPSIHFAIFTCTARKAHEVHHRA